MTALPPPGPPPAAGTPAPVPAPSILPPPTAVPPQGSGTAPSSLFAGLNQADATKDGVWVRPGHYFVRCNVMKGGTSQKPGAGDYQVTEHTVCKVLGTAEAIEAGTEPHRVGEVVTDLKMRKHKSFLGNVNAQLAGMEGMTIEALKADLARSGKTVEQLAAESLSENQPYAGRFFEIVARQIPTQTLRQQVNAQTGQIEMVPGKFTRINYIRPVSAAELASQMTLEEKASVFPEDSLEKILATEAAVHQAMGTTPAAAPAAAPEGNVVTMAGVNYILPVGWQTRDDAPGQGWDGSAWHPLSPA